MIRKTAGSAIWGGVLALAVGSTLGVPPASAQEPQNDVTYARDVAPIIQENCQVCHQPGSIAPMSLMSFDDVRLYAPQIRSKVENRVMPPWHIDRTVGIQEFKNDRGLSDLDVRTITQWVDNGTPFGDERDMPPPAVFPDPYGWQFEGQFGTPDLVVASEPFTLAAATQDKWFRPVTETGLTEERWVRAIEIRPVGKDGKAIIHHVLAFLEQQEEETEMSAGSVQTSSRGSMGGPGLFMEWAVGKRGEFSPTVRVS